MSAQKEITPLISDLQATVDRICERYVANWEREKAMLGQIADDIRRLQEGTDQQLRVVEAVNEVCGSGGVDGDTQGFTTKPIAGQLSTGEHKSTPECSRFNSDPLPSPIVGECEAWLSFGNSPTNEDGYECPRSGKLRRNGQVLCDECWSNTPMEFRQ